METKHAVHALAALAHEGRLNAFRLLVRAGGRGMAAGELARRLEMKPNTLTGAVNALAHAGLIDSRREGRSVIYFVRYPDMTGLLQFLMEDCCAGSPAICAPLAEIALVGDCKD
jgi:ArsR family transcriptional regulator